MKKLNLICALAIAALLTTGLNAANLVVNHSFNDGQAPPNEWAPAHWNVGSPGDAAVSRIFDDSSDAGTNCLQEYVNSGTFPDNYSDLITHPDSRIDVTSISTLYWQFSYKLAASGGNGPTGTPRVDLRFFDASDTFLGEDNVYPADQGVVWTRIPMRTKAVPAGSAYADVRMSCNIFGSYVGAARIDDVYVSNSPIPEPTLLLGGLILGLAFLRRK